MKRKGKYTYVNKKNSKTLTKQERKQTNATALQQIYTLKSQGTTGHLNDHSNTGFVAKTELKHRTIYSNFVTLTDLLFECCSLNGIRDRQ